MDDLTCYIPTDRLHAMARGQTLPEFTHGAALFADISGFTSLTEQLVQELGPQRGPEEITRNINAVFESLITELDQYQGSVLIFGGDALTCWFDGDHGLRAVACALKMQTRMQAFAAMRSPSGKDISLGMKVAIAVGGVHRFLIGDPSLQLFDVLAGRTVDRLSQCEHHASRGEVVVDGETADLLGEAVHIRLWRADDEADQGNLPARYGVVSELRVDVVPNPWPDLPEGGLDREALRPWMLPPVYERLSSGGGEFLAEIRPALPMFLHFSGIDFDGDPNAHAKLDIFIRQVTRVLANYESSVLSVLMGDKGSHLYTAFGAPVAHEDEAARAAAAALELRAMTLKLGFIDEIRIGIGHGWLFAGASGGETRRTYVTMGSEVNLAARLMQAAGPGEILIANRVRASLGKVFVGADLTPIKVKGRADLIPVALLEGLHERQSIRLNEPRYALPMVGRAAELDLVKEKLELALTERGQVVGITGEAGVGKSRLVAEVIHLVNTHNLLIYGGECEAYGTNTNYLVWRKIWQNLFGIVASDSLEAQIQRLEQVLDEINPSLKPRIPLLGSVLNLAIPDNELTQAFEAKLRKTSLESLLSDCLRGLAGKNPLVFVLEDAHWLDDLSNELLTVLGRAIHNLPVLIVLSYRPPQMERLQRRPLAGLQHFTEISLGDFTPQESEQLIRLKLEQMTGSRENVPPALLGRITERAGGNPFYIEELLNYVRDQKLDPRDVHVLERVVLPDSLYSLILSRIDRISEGQKVTMKVASVIGRMFRAAWVWGYYPQVGDPRMTIRNLTTLYQADLTPVVPSEPEETYLFKHILTQEVAYESLPFNTRSRLHGLFGAFIERSYPDQIERYIDLLAFHYDNSDQPEKRRAYLKLAGEMAQTQYANSAALSYYERLMPLAEPSEKVDVSLKLGQVLVLVGRWNGAAETIHQALAQAEQLNQRRAVAESQMALGEIHRKQGRFGEALEWLKRARQECETQGYEAGMSQVLHYSGTLAANQGDFDQAKSYFEQSLAIRRALQDRPNIASSLNNLGNVAAQQGRLDEARGLHEEALSIRRELGDRYAIGASLSNLGMVAIDQENYSQARALLEEGLAAFREVGDPWRTANALNNLGSAVRLLGDYDAAGALYAESLKIDHELDDKWSMAYLLEDIACLAAGYQQSERAAKLTGAAFALRQAIGAPLSDAEQKKLDRILNPARVLVSDNDWAAARQAGERMNLAQAVDYAMEEFNSKEL